MYVFVLVSEKFSGSKMVRKLVAARPEKQPLDADFGHKLSFEYISPSQPDLAIDNEIVCTLLIVFLDKELFGKFIIVL